MNNNQNARPGNDLWIAVGVVMCLATGAALTYSLGFNEAPPKPVAALNLQGDAIDGPLGPKPAVQFNKTNKIDAPLAPIQKEGNEYQTLTFDILGGYPYEVPGVVEGKGGPQVAKDQVPEGIKKLNQKNVAVRGFMVAVDTVKGGVKSFFLVKDQSMCCYGRTPRMNDLVAVRMPEGKTTKCIMDQPVTVLGKMEVGEEIQDGAVMNLYRMTADDVAGPLDL